MSLTNEAVRDTLFVPLSDFTDNEMFLLRSVVGNLEPFVKGYVFEAESKELDSPIYGLTSERFEILIEKLHPERKESIFNRKDLNALNCLALYSYKFPYKYANYPNFKNLDPITLIEFRRSLYKKMGYSEENANQMIRAGH